MSPRILLRVEGLVFAVWFVHLGADRALGYGLKYATGVKDTHLGRGQDVPAAVLSDRGP